MAFTGSFQVLKAKQEFLFKSPVISLGTSPSDLVKKWTEVKHVLDQFDQFTGSLKIDVKSDPSEESDPAEKAFEALIDGAKQEIVCSALRPEMLTLYNGSLFNPRMSVNVIEANLKQVLGEITPKEAKRQQKAEFLKLTRRCDINEKFETFLDRLIAKAALLSSNTEIQEELVSEQFDSSLRPMDNEALEVFSESVATGINLIRDNAQLLDRKKFFKRSEAETNHVELQEANTILIGQVDKLTRDMATFQSNSESREDLLSDKITQLQQQFNQLVQSIQSGNVTSVNSNSSSASPASPSIKPSGKPKKKAEFDKNKFRDPDFFCYNCGLVKCPNKHKCDGDDTKFCVICQKNGHVASSRKYHKPAGSPKKTKNE